MGAEKEGTKGGGGYVGGFFHLFDWTSKSRKKLFASKSDSPESKQERKFGHNVAMTHRYLVDEDENGVGANARGSCDHSYASSVTDDEACGKKAPSVVARLMGLDSLPTSNFSDPYASPYSDTRSLQDAQFHRKDLNHQYDHQSLYSGKLVEKVEGSSRNFIEPKPQKTITRPIEKFQTEVLPPKSAKSIPVTHHRLMSPIKGFVPTNNAAYIMEAAARIIEPGSQTSSKGKTPSASSTVSLRVKDVKDKLESSQKGHLIGPSSMTSKTRELKDKRENFHRTTRASEPSQRPVESNAAKYLKGQPMNRSWNGTMDTSIKSPVHAEEDSSSKNKGKSISLAIQAKVNVQRRGGLSSTGGRNSMGQKEHLDTKSNQPQKAHVQRISHKKSPGHNSSGVLRQNNLKQNHSIDNDKLPSKPLVSNSQGRKVASGESPYGRHRSSSSKSIAKSKAGSRNSAMETTDSEKEVLYTSTNSFPRKKRTTDKDWNDRVVDNLFIDKTPKPVKSNLVGNKQYGWTEDVKKKDMDVVSFTFTTPLARSNPGFETSGQAGQNTNGLSLDQRIKRVLLDTDNTRSPIGYNVIGGDALGMLLEQKLRELTGGVETSCKDVSNLRQPSITEASSDDQVTNLSIGNSNPRLQQKKDQDMFFTDRLSGSHGSDMSFTSLPELSLKHNSWVDEMEPQSFNCRQPSPISVLEPSFSIESCESSMSAEITSTEGSKLCSSIQVQQVQGFNFSTKFRPTETDAELSDSASSTSAGTILKKQTSTFSIKKFGRSSTWELDYVKEILCNVELMYMNFSLGRSREIVNPHLFNQLESRKGGFDSESRMRRKVIFDCVSECLELRCMQYVKGGYTMWTKGEEMLRRKEWLAEDVYKEISSWKGMRDSMVDELVDKDMSSKYGKWLDYDADAFEFGAEVVDQIFNSLVDDVVYEFLQL